MRFGLSGLVNSSQSKDEKDKATEITERIKRLALRAGRMFLISRHRVEWARWLCALCGFIFLVVLCDPPPPACNRNAVK